MGLFSIKKQLLSVIEWTDSSNDTIVYRFKHSNREEIMNSSTLIVRPSQIAVFVHKGEICDIFAPGTYKLVAENIPIITKVLSLPTGFNSPIKAEVYFINTKQMTGLKWGTQNPIMMRDNEFGNIRIRAYGVYSYKVVNARKFMEEMFGTNELYTTSEVGNHMRPTLVSGFSDVVAENNISALDLARNYQELSTEIIEHCQKAFNNFGLELKTLVIENISLPEEVEKILDERTKIGVLDGKMASYTQLQAAEAIKDAANNESSGNLAGLGVGLGAGVGIGNLFTESLNSVTDKPTIKPKDFATEKKCTKCGASNTANAKFCSECGNKFAKEQFCPNCGEKIKSNAKFCSNCGEKL